MCTGNTGCICASLNQMSNDDLLGLHKHFESEFPTIVSAAVANGDTGNDNDKTNVSKSGDIVTETTDVKKEPVIETAKEAVKKTVSVEALKLEYENSLKEVREALAARETEVARYAADVTMLKGFISSLVPEKIMCPTLLQSAAQVIEGFDASKPLAEMAPAVIGKYLTYTDTVLNLQAEAAKKQVEIAAEAAKTEVLPEKVESTNAGAEETEVKPTVTPGVNRPRFHFGEATERILRANKAKADTQKYIRL